MNLYEVIGQPLRWPERARRSLATVTQYASHFELRTRCRVVFIWSEQYRPGIYSAKLLQPWRQQHNNCFFARTKLYTYTLKMQILIVITFAAAVVFSVQSQSDSNFIFSRGPVPNPFLLHQHYPDRPESVECRPIRLHIERGSRRFVSELVTNEHTNVQFTNADARIMSSRLHRHLNELAETFYETHNVWITVIKAWAEQGDTDVTDTNSLHYEGMCDYGGCHENVHQLKLQCVCLTVGYIIIPSLL